MYILNDPTEYSNYVLKVSNVGSWLHSFDGTNCDTSAPPCGTCSAMCVVVPIQQENCLKQVIHL